MGSRELTLSSNYEKDSTLEELAQDIFGSDEHYQHKLPRQNNQSISEKNHQIHRGASSNHHKYTNDNKPSKLERDTSNKKEVQSLGVVSPINVDKTERKWDSVQYVAEDIQQVITQRFLELSDEFYTLSERLSKVNLPDVSERLTKVLDERRKLMVMLSDIRKPADTSTRHVETTKSHKRDSSVNKKKQEELGRLRKSKSVHWSDEQLGGSIVQEPSNVKHRKTISPSILLVNDHSKKDFDCHNDFKSLYQHPNYDKVEEVELNRPDTHGKLPPPYPALTQIDSRRRREEITDCDAPGNLCSSGFGHAIGCVEEILNEAATLRREACYMLWRARYLEQCCDAGEIFNQFYQSSFNIPVLPCLKQYKD